MIDATWRPSLKAFFDERAGNVAAKPTLRDLCFIAGRDPRLWSDDVVYQDMIASVVQLCGADRSSAVLELGCASGFIAVGVAPQVRTYRGVDLAPSTVKVAKRLKIANAAFSVADGAALPLADGIFDAAFCYDVFTNIPAFADGVPLIREMARVVRPGGRIMVGSIPDDALKDEFQAQVYVVQAQLDDRFGPVGEGPRRRPPGTAERLWTRWFAPAKADGIVPQILCYYFDKRDFVDLGDELGMRTVVSAVHAKNPYAAFRFNVVYEKK